MQEWLLLGIKIHFWSSNICKLSLFLVSTPPLSQVQTVQPWPSPVDASASRRSLGFLRSWLATWIHTFCQKKKKGLWHHIPLCFCPLSSLFFALFLPSGLIFSTLSLVIVQHPLCAWTLFIHELVNTSVNEGKRRFYRLSLCVEEAVWTARAPFLERMSRPLSALRVLWPFTSLFSPIHHFSALLSVSSATFSPPHIYHWLC